MWRSRISSSSPSLLLLRSLIRLTSSPLDSKAASDTLIGIAVLPPPSPAPAKWCPLASISSSARSFSSANDAAFSPEDDAATGHSFGDDAAGSIQMESWNFGERDASPIAFGDGAESSIEMEKSWNFGEVVESPLGFGDDPEVSNGKESWNFGKADASSIAFCDGRDVKTEDGEESLGSLWEESVHGDDAASIFTPQREAVIDGVESPQIDMEQVGRVESLLMGTSPEQLESSLDRALLEFLSLSEELVAYVLRSSNVSAGNAIAFFNWASRYDPSVKTLSIVQILVDAISSSDELSKMDAYKLWDLVKEIGNEKGPLNTQILNQLISMFWKLGKAKAGLEVFNKFDEFSCSRNGDTYYFTIEALGKRSWIDTAWSVCEKMLDSGNLPDVEKVGKIITFFCKGKKSKEAHLVYLMAKEQKVLIRRTHLDFLITGLSTKNETVHTALGLLADYPSESLRYAGRTFALVVRGLCKIKDLQEVKKLLITMMASGPMPGNAMFNYVITALSKAGEMDDAVALAKLMESRGLRPDVYTYSVIMSGFAKGGLMDEAYNIYSEAKKRHPKLSPVTYHILLRGYCKLEEFDKALKCLKEMQEDGVQPNADEYNKLIQSLCLKALDWGTAEKLLEEMTERGLYLKGITRSLIAAVKELEGEAQAGEISLEA